MNGEMRNAYNLHNIATIATIVTRGNFTKETGDYQSIEQRKNSSVE